MIYNTLHITLTIQRKSEVTTDVLDGQSVLALQVAPGVSKFRRQVMNEENNWILITTKGTYSWSSETDILQRSIKQWLRPYNFRHDVFNLISRNPYCSSFLTSVSLSQLDSVSQLVSLSTHRSRYSTNNILINQIENCLYHRNSAHVMISFCRLSNQW